MELTVYLAGEVHSDWRKEIVEGAEKEGLPIEFLSPITDHDASDDVGVSILGSEEKAFWKDHKGAKINAIRTRTALEQADVVVVKFGEKYKQWNAAFDAGIAVASSVCRQSPDGLEIRRGRRLSLTTLLILQSTTPPASPSGSVCVMSLHPGVRLVTVRAFIFFEGLGFGQFRLVPCAHASPSD